ncbi:NADH dehydrogenase [Roseibium aquae]|uniref:Probable inorganic carbon transporter subunit DabB n=1 Tax=Roseibium aquae TaxID=1323746 RepID=A0A916TIG2_9HYPH|nr:proton-conducting transporter membrane subunit [Roseibium aquae]GGB46887.1 NADH dehydrogenase [Roseibium aquae]
MLLNLFPLLAPLSFLTAALLYSRQPGRLTTQSMRIGEIAALAALGISILCAILLFTSGPGQSVLLGVFGTGFQVKLDALSVTMLVLVSFVGWVVLRYSATYLDGEERQGAFMGLMSGALASVLFLVTAGTLFQLIAGWMLAGAFLHRLLLFYPERPGAQRAARKKTLVSRAADASLIVAAILLAIGYGTQNIATILDAARSGSVPAEALFATGFLALAAILKSAQLPLHGWLTEVMEAPTPVSALLHAGLINAGGFLIIRFADVMIQAPGILAALALVGGLSALFGGLIMLTQSAVKTSLAWSTIAQMGFMILQCGLALFPFALLHIVAHSLYKAHAFLSSGTAVNAVTEAKKPGPVAIPNAAAVGKAFALAIGIFLAIGFAFGFAGKSPQAIALGAILIFGVAYLIAQGLADAAPKDLTLRTLIYSLAASVSYFALQTGATFVMQGTVPPPPAPDNLEWAVIILAVVSFGGVALAQALLPLWSSHPTAAALRVHIANGLYLNTAFDRLIGGWSKKQNA